MKTIFKRVFLTTSFFILISTALANGYASTYPWSVTNSATPAVFTVPGFPSGYTVVEIYTQGPSPIYITGPVTKTSCAAILNASSQCTFTIQAPAVTKPQQTTINIAYAQQGNAQGTISWTHYTTAKK